MSKTNKLFYGDNPEVMRKYLPDESVDLCYIDPPFNSKRNYNNVGKDDVAQAQAKDPVRLTYEKRALQAKEGPERPLFRLLKPGHGLQAGSRFSPSCGGAPRRQ